MSSTQLTRGSVRRALALSAAGAMVFALTPVQSAFATHGADGARDIQEAGDVCENADGDAFNDITDARIDAAADCLNDLNIARGFGDNQYNPGQAVTREQMASFISRKLESANEYNRPDDAPEASFTDREKIALVHVNNVDILADLGITVGFDDNTYRPGAAVTRGQMASFIVREMETILGQELTPNEDHFTDDDGTVHEDNINVLADLGVVEGFEGGDYRPGADVTRGQMALFLARNVDALNNEFGITFDVVVEQGEVVLTVQTVEAGNEVTGTIGGNPTDVTVSGCGLTDQALTDDDTAAEDFQFSFTIPSNQPAGDCVLTFDFTDEDGNAQSVDVTITVTRPASFTVRPELTSARIVSTTTTTQATLSNPAGTVVEYTFDENVDLFAPTASNFHVYKEDGTHATEGTKTAVSRDGNSVRIRFTDIDTASEAEVLTLATVDLGAVQDNDGVSNPEGDAAIGTAGSTTAGAAGVTDAPDLVSVGGFRETLTTGDRAVDFTFDENANTTGTTGFSLILINGEEIPCTGPAAGDTTTASGGNTPGGNGTTTITVVCPDSGDGTAASAQNVARGTVDTGTVTDGANTNPLQAADVANSGNTADPDLVSAEFRPSTTTAADQVLYTFDEAVSTANATDFFVYDPDSNEDPGVSATINTTDARQVLITFANNTVLDDAVGANVVDGAVTAADTGTDTNQQDEVGVTNTQTSSRTPGETAAPQLVSVALGQGTDQFGNATGYRATYTFDQDVTVTSPTLFFLYEADGTRWQSTTCTLGSTEDTDHTVTCTAYGTATSAEIGSATLGTVDNGAVTAETGGLTNPEGAAPTSGGTGTPA